MIYNLIIFNIKKGIVLSYNLCRNAHTNFNINCYHKSYWKIFQVYISKKLTK